MGTTARIVLMTTLLSLGAAAQAGLVTTSYNVNFIADQSLWSGGPSGGFSSSGSVGTSVVGAYYDVNSNSGTVSASVNGMIQATYSDLVNPTDQVNVMLNYVAGGSSLSSAFGASAEAGAYVDISVCIIPNPFGGCIQSVGFDDNIPLIDEGFFLNPSTSFASELGTTRSASALDELVGIGGVDIPLLGTIGATINLDLAQTISLTPTAVEGTVMFQNQTTGEMGLSAFAIGTDGSFDVDLGELSVGVWDFLLTDILLENSFSNDIDMVLRPQVDYIIGSWSPAQFPFDLLDQSFSLDFSTIATLGAFSIEVAAIPLPAAVWLLGSALLGFGLLGRRR